MLQTTKFQLLSLLVTSIILLYWLLHQASSNYWTTSITYNPSSISFSNLNQHTRVLILTPFKQSAHLIDTYFKNLESLDYPHHLISLGFIVSDSTDGTVEQLQARAVASKQGAWNGFEKITIIQKDFAYDLPSDELRHSFDVQVQRRAVMARSRNTLLSTALDERHDYVLWLDGDVIEYPKTLLTDLIGLNKDVVVPNCWWHSYDEEGGYDKNNWQETAESVAFQKTLASDAVLVEGYSQVMNTHRKLLVDMRHENGTTDRYHAVPLDAVGGTCTLVKAQVHRDGAIFPPFPYQHQVETEGFAKMAKAIGYEIWGLPNYLVYHYI
ncbi:hypothetical protein G6F46_008893 [Rhizopus delemar]|uniref:Anp1-domain-containing protein n=2 Tax=Rhizopus TaxID=4842 RepID=A0A9P6YRN3_9FUNG|nr:hypothetical protein G6F43_012269 [Rhizopus delemar]KAG1535039.1 hypothetical protein G6F51_011755 [Rhizopus arrhizus]KAG1447117.1 hypothetical protein G6F55_011248 [Rhizopus delemar]KAG1489420.1 hypothetical protein G6F54_011451 [Rhizopus delemar]KAG1509217.1 hypothetical protein G6F53_007618 [Rhizopus delemar]